MRGRVHFAMFDGIKIQDVSVEVDALLANDRLTFGGLVDTHTGFILNPIRRAQDRGLNFQLIPRRTGMGYRVEVKGSLHKFFNNGLHNADQFTVNSLLLTLDRLATEYGFDLLNSTINNIEFGVNIELPFPVSKVLDNLICYKNQPFQSDSHSQTPYYACNRQHYTVKIYDKGKQKGMGENLLRFEIRVRKMQYFNGTGVQLGTLADLLNVSNYKPLGVLLVNAFNDILFDDPTINQKSLTAKERTLYLQCRNPRFWVSPDGLTQKQAAAHRQRISRNKGRFRALLQQHGSNWHRDVSALVRQTWERLAVVDDDLLMQIDMCKRAWESPTNFDIQTCDSCEDVVKEGGQTCHKLTDAPDAHLSRINTLCSELLCDEGKPVQPPTPETIVCPITGVAIDQPLPRQRFVSATMLRTNDDLLLTLEHRYKQYAKGSKENREKRTAHNLRNDESNPRNNLKRSINKIYRQPLLFDVSDTLVLTDQQLDILNGG